MQTEQETPSTPRIPQFAERVITIRKIGNFDELLRGHTNKMFAAIGYLANWASPEAFPKVVLACTGDHGVSKGVEITAYYYQPDGKVGFVIGAIWHDDTADFSFHS